MATLPEMGAPNAGAKSRGGVCGLVTPVASGRGNTRDAHIDNATAACSSLQNQESFFLPVTRTRRSEVKPHLPHTMCRGMYVCRERLRWTRDAGVARARNPVKRSQTSRPLAAMRCFSRVSVRCVKRAPCHVVIRAGPPRPAHAATQCAPRANVPIGIGAPQPPACPRKPYSAAGNSRRHKACLPVTKGAQSFVHPSSFEVEVHSVASGWWRTAIELLSVCGIPSLSQMTVSRLLFRELCRRATSAD